MPSVHFKDVSFRYSTAVTVIEGASFDLGPGWVGVAGANGGGKTTLLRLVARELAPDQGTVILTPPEPPVLCRQEVGAIDATIEMLAATTDGSGRRIRGELRLEPANLERWVTLSPGERKRWQIGAALAIEPAVLLLDEPTNHLDAAAREVLAAALRRHRGVGLVVSHDRTFLNELTAKTLRIERGAVELRTGSYDTARTAWDAATAERQGAYAAAKAEQRKLERRVADQRQAAEEKRARHRRELRTAGPKDHDTRSVEAKGRHEAGEATAARRLQTTGANATRAAEAVAGFEMRREVGRDFFFDYVPARRPRLLDYTGPLQAGPEVIAAGVSVDVMREDRIWLRGPNGAGKTTLLEALVEASTLPAGRLLYLPQELERDAAAATLADLRHSSRDEKGRILKLVAALGVEPDRLLASDLPSPGEARKLFMATGMATGAWCLLLDEPTNHLDLPSIERLEAAVAGYPGAVVLVTHDDEFAAVTTTATWQLEAGTLTAV